MTTSTAWTAFFISLCLLSTPLALWLLSRRTPKAQAAALVLALLATGSGFMAWQLHGQATPPTASPIFILAAGAPGQFQTIPAAALDQALAQARGRPVLLDFSADWCSGCQVWKQQVFNRGDVQQALQPLVLLRIDATDMTPATQAALNRYDLAGLPALISFNRQGQEQGQLRLLGEMPAPDFINWVHTRLLPVATM